MATSMFQQMMVKVLLSHFQTFLEPTSFHGDQIEAGLWTGSLTLSRLLLKKSLLNELVDVPIALHHCCISQIEIIIPWNEIFDENSIISIRIEGLSVILKANYESSREEVERIEQKIKTALLNKFEKSSSSSSTNSSSSSSFSFVNSALNWVKESFSSRILSLLKKIEFSLVSTHIRFEDCQSNPNNFYAFGLYFDALSISTPPMSPSSSSSSSSLFSFSLNPSTTNTSSSHSIHIEKTFELSNLNAYWNPIFLHSLDVSSRTLTLDDELSASELTRFLSQMNLGFYTHRFILSSFSFSMQSLTAIDISSKYIQLSGSVFIPEITLELEDTQYREILQLQLLLNEYPKLRTLLQFRPKCSVRENPSAWWRHAIHMVLCKLTSRGLDQRETSPSTQFQRSCRDKVVYGQLWERHLKGGRNSGRSDREAKKEEEDDEEEEKIGDEKDPYDDESFIESINSDQSSENLEEDVSKEALYPGFDREPKWFQRLYSNFFQSSFTNSPSFRVEDDDDADKHARVGSMSGWLFQMVMPEPPPFDSDVDFGLEVPPLDSRGREMLRMLEKRLTLDQIMYFRTLTERRLRVLSSSAVEQNWSSWTSSFAPAAEHLASQVPPSRSPPLKAWTFAAGQLGLHCSRLSLSLALPAANQAAVPPFLSLVMTNAHFEMVDASSALDSSEKSYLLHVHDLTLSSPSSSSSSKPPCPILVCSPAQAEDSFLFLQLRLDGSERPTITGRFGDLQLNVCPTALWLRCLQAFLRTTPLPSSSSSLDTTPEAGRSVPPRDRIDVSWKRDVDYALHAISHLDSQPHLDLSIGQCIVCVLPREDSPQRLRLHWRAVALEAFSCSMTSELLRKKGASFTIEGIGIAFIEGGEGEKKNGGKAPHSPVNLLNPPLDFLLTAKLSPFFSLGMNSSSIELHYSDDLHTLLMPFLLDLASLKLDAVVHHPTFSSLSSYDEKSSSKGEEGGDESFYDVLPPIYSRSRSCSVVTARSELYFDSQDALAEHLKELSRLLTVKERKFNELSSRLQLLTISNNGGDGEDIRGELQGRVKAFELELKQLKEEYVQALMENELMNLNSPLSLGESDMVNILDVSALYPAGGSESMQKAITCSLPTLLAFSQFPPHSSSRLIRREVPPSPRISVGAVQIMMEFTFPRVSLSFRSLTKSVKFIGSVEQMGFSLLYKGNQEGGHHQDEVQLSFSIGGLHVEQASDFFPSFPPLILLSTESSHKNTPFVSVDYLMMMMRSRKDDDDDVELFLHSLRMDVQTLLITLTSKTLSLINMLSASPVPSESSASKQPDKSSPSPSLRSSSSSLGGAHSFTLRSNVEGIQCAFLTEGNPASSSLLSCRCSHFTLAAMKETADMTRLTVSLRKVGLTFHQEEIIFTHDESMPLLDVQLSLTTEFSTTKIGVSGGLTLSPITLTIPLEHLLKDVENMLSLQNEEFISLSTLNGSPLSGPEGEEDKRPLDVVTPSALDASLSKDDQSPLSFLHYFDSSTFIFKIHEIKFRVMVSEASILAFGWKSFDWATSIGLNSLKKKCLESAMIIRGISISQNGEEAVLYPLDFSLRLMALAPAPFSSPSVKKSRKLVAFAVDSKVAESSSSLPLNHMEVTCTVSKIQTFIYPMLIKSIVDSSSHLTDLYSSSFSTPVSSSKGSKHLTKSSPTTLVNMLSLNISLHTHFSFQSIELSVHDEVHNEVYFLFGAFEADATLLDSNKADLSASLASVELSLRRSPPSSSDVFLSSPNKGHGVLEKGSPVCFTLSITASSNGVEVKLLVSPVECYLLPSFHILIHTLLSCANNDTVTAAELTHNRSEEDSFAQPLMAPLPAPSLSARQTQLFASSRRSSYVLDSSTALALPHGISSVRFSLCVERIVLNTVIPARILSMTLSNLNLAIAFQSVQDTTESCKCLQINLSLEDMGSFITHDGAIENTVLLSPFSGKIQHDFEYVAALGMSQKANFVNKMDLQFSPLVIRLETELSWLYDIQSIILQPVILLFPKQGRPYVDSDAVSKNTPRSGAGGSDLLATISDRLVSADIVIRTSLSDVLVTISAPNAYLSLFQCKVSKINLSFESSISSRLVITAFPSFYFHDHQALSMRSVLNVFDLALSWSSLVASPSLSSSQSPPSSPTSYRAVRLIHAAKEEGGSNIKYNPASLGSLLVTTSCKLNFNISPALLRSLIVLCTSFASAFNAVPYKPAIDSSPYLVVMNQTGEHILVAFYGNLLKEDGGREVKELVVDEEVKTLLTCQEAFQELALSSTSLSSSSGSSTSISTLAGKSLRLRMNGFEDVYHIPLDSTLPILHSFGALSIYSQLFTASNGPRMLYLTSPVTVKNCTNLSLQIGWSISKGSSSMNYAQLDSNSCTPLSCFASQRVLEDALFTLALQSNGAVTACPASFIIDESVTLALSSNIFVEMKVVMDEENGRKGFQIRISASLSVTNLLASAIEVDLHESIETQAVEKVFYLKSSESLSCAAFPPSKAIFMSLKLLTSYASSSVPHPLWIAPITKDCPCYNSHIDIPTLNGSNLRLNVNIELVGNIRRISVYVPYWILSFSSFPLRFRHDIDTEAAEGNRVLVNGKDDLAAGQFEPLHIESEALRGLCSELSTSEAVNFTADKRETIGLQSSNLVLAQLGYTNSDEGGTVLSFQSQRSYWSRGMCLDYEGPMELDLNAPSDNTSSSSSLFSWFPSLSRKTIPLALLPRGGLNFPFHRTRLLVVTDRVLLLNLTGRAVEMRQASSAPTVRIEAGGRHSLNFEHAFDHSRLQFRLGCAGWEEWSGFVPISSQEDFTLQLQSSLHFDDGKSRKVCYLHIVVAIVKSCTRITLVQSDIPPFRVENLTTASLLLSQFSSSSAPITLPSNHSCGFAWQDGVKTSTKKLLVIEDGCTRRKIASLSLEGPCQMISEDTAVTIETFHSTLLVKVMSSLELSKRTTSSASTTTAALPRFEGALYLPHLSFSFFLHADEPRPLSLSIYSAQLKFTLMEDGVQEGGFAIDSVSLTNHTLNANISNMLTMKPTSAPSGQLVAIEFLIKRDSYSGNIGRISLHMSPLYISIHGADVLALASQFQAQYMIASLSGITHSSLIIDTKQEGGLDEALLIALQGLQRLQARQTAASLVYLKEIFISKIHTILSIDSLVASNIQPPSTLLPKGVFALILMLCNILTQLDSSYLAFSKLKLTNVYNTQQGIAKLLLAHYNAQAAVNAMLLLGSLSIFGSPVQSVTIIVGAWQDLLSAFSLSHTPLANVKSFIVRSSALFSASAGTFVLSMTRILEAFSTGLLLSLENEGVFDAIIKGYERKGIGGAILGVAATTLRLGASPLTTMLGLVTQTGEQVSSSLIPAHLRYLMPVAVTTLDVIEDDDDDDDDDDDEMNGGGGGGTDEAKERPVFRGRGYGLQQNQRVILSSDGFVQILEYDGDNHVKKRRNLAMICEIVKVEMRVDLCFPSEEQRRASKSTVYYSLVLSLSEHAFKTTSGEILLNFRSPKSSIAFQKALSKVKPGLIDSALLQHMHAIHFV